MDEVCTPLSSLRAQHSPCHVSRAQPQRGRLTRVTCDFDLPQVLATLSLATTLAQSRTLSSNEIENIVLTDFGEEHTYIRIPPCVVDSFCNSMLFILKSSISAFVSGTADRGALAEAIAQHADPSGNILR